MSHASRAYAKRKAKRDAQPAVKPPVLPSTAPALPMRFVTARDAFLAAGGADVLHLVHQLSSLGDDAIDSFLAEFFPAIPRRVIQDSEVLDLIRYVRSPDDHGVQRMNRQLNKWQTRRDDYMSVDRRESSAPRVVSKRDDKTNWISSKIKIEEQVSLDDIATWYERAVNALPIFRLAVTQLWQHHKYRILRLRYQKPVRGSARTVKRAYYAIELEASNAKQKHRGPTAPRHLGVGGSFRLKRVILAQRVVEAPEQPAVYIPACPETIGTSASWPKRPIVTTHDGIYFLRDVGGTPLASYPTFDALFAECAKRGITTVKVARVPPTKLAPAAHAVRRPSDLVALPIR